MSRRCPDWERLLAARELGEDPPGWEEARQHLQRCLSCRRTALAQDPLLLFATLPPPLVEPNKVEEMVASVEWLLCAERLREKGQEIERVRRSRGSWLRLAATVLLALFLDRSLPRSEPLPAGTSPSEAMPSIDAVESSTARLYQLSDEQVQVVWIVDAALDV